MNSYAIIGKESLNSLNVTLEMAIALHVDTSIKLYEHFGSPKRSVRARYLLLPNACRRQKMPRSRNLKGAPILVRARDGIWRIEIAAQELASWALLSKASKLHDAVAGVVK